MPAHEPIPAYFDRFDICEAWYLALAHCHGGQFSPEYRRLCRLTRPGFFSPGPMLSIESLTDNGRAIYHNAVVKLTGREPEEE